jgi:hypothetical protein
MMPVWAKAQFRQDSRFLIIFLLNLQIDARMPGMRIPTMSAQGLRRRLALFRTDAVASPSNLSMR